MDTSKLEMRLVYTLAWIDLLTALVTMLTAGHPINFWSLPFGGISPKSPWHPLLAGPLLSALLATLIVVDGTVSKFMKDVLIAPFVARGNHSRWAIFRPVVALHTNAAIGSLLWLVAVWGLYATVMTAILRPTSSFVWGSFVFAFGTTIARLVFFNMPDPDETKAIEGANPTFVADALPAILSPLPGRPMLVWNLLGPIEATVKEAGHSFYKWPRQRAIAIPLGEPVTKFPLTVNVGVLDLNFQVTVRFAATDVSLASAAKRGLFAGRMLTPERIRADVEQINKAALYLYLNYLPDNVPNADNNTAPSGNGAPALDAVVRQMKVAFGRVQRLRLASQLGEDALYDHLKEAQDAITEMYGHQETLTLNLMHETSSREPKYRKPAFQMLGGVYEVYYEMVGFAPAANASVQFQEIHSDLDRILSKLTQDDSQKAELLTRLMESLKNMGAPSAVLQDITGSARERLASTARERISNKSRADRETARAQWLAGEQQRVMAAAAGELPPVATKPHPVPVQTVTIGDTKRNGQASRNDW